MNRWMQLLATSAVSVLAGCIGAVLVLQLGGADEHIRRVTQPAIGASADRQQKTLDATISKERQEILDALGVVTRNLLGRLTTLEDRQYRIGSGPECDFASQPVAVVTVTFGSSATEDVCVVENSGRNWLPTQ